MLNIPEQEIYKDIAILKGDDYTVELNIKTKRAIGAKYGMDPKDATRTEKILMKIYEYLRELRKTKSSFTQQDITDFRRLTNSLQRYKDLEPFLQLESPAFLKYILDFTYNYLLNKKNNATGRPMYTKYTIDNIDNIALSRDNFGVLANFSELERYKSTKKFYDENYGSKAKEKEESSKRLYALDSKITSKTYRNRMMLQKYLVDFINECYEKYVKDETYYEIKKLYDKYWELTVGKNHYYDEGTDDNNYVKYREALHFMMSPYYYFEQDKDNDVITKEFRIDKSIEWFDSHFNKLLEKEILRPIILSDAELSDIEVSELFKVNYGYYFTVSYGQNKKLYASFILKHEYIDTKNLDKVVELKQHFSRFNQSVIAYEMKVTKAPISLEIVNSINESFDFNLLTNNFDFNS